VDEFPPFRDEEFRAFRLQRRKPDYPRIPDIEYCLDVKPRSGGFGFVYKGKHINLDREVAVKVTHRRAASADEAVALAKFQHPNIVTVHDTGLTEDGRRYIVTEWLAGGSLDDWLQANVRLSARRWAEVFETIAKALDVAHVGGFLHRDIKPGNILFARADADWFQTPKLGDFGLAVPGTSGPDSSGTPAYQAPELHEKGGRPTRFSDVYSLGLTMWQCLADRMPTETPLPRLSHIPRTLAAIVVKCLSNSEEGRYGQLGNLEDMNQRPAWLLAEDLQAFLKNRPTLARPLNPVQSAGLWVRRSPWQAGTLTTLTLGLIASGGFAWQLMESQKRERIETKAKLTAVKLVGRATEAKLRAELQARVHRYARTLERVQRQIKDNKSVAVINELDNCDSAYKGGWEWLYLRSQRDVAVDGLDVKSPVQAIAVSVDTRLAVAVAGGKIHLGEWETDLTRLRPIQEAEQRDFRQSST